MNQQFENFLLEYVPDDCRKSARARLTKLLEELE